MVSLKLTCLVLVAFVSCGVEGGRWQRGYVPNPSFEYRGGWKVLKRGYYYTHWSASHGTTSIAARVNGGVQKVFRMPRWTIAFRARVDSMNFGVYPQQESNTYGLYCHLRNNDNTMTWGRSASCKVPSPRWQTTVLHFKGYRTMKNMRCQLRFQGYKRGHVFFDNFRVEYYTLH